MTPDQMMTHLLLPPRAVMDDLERDLHGFRGRRWVRRRGRFWTDLQRAWTRRRSTATRVAAPAPQPCPEPVVAEC